VSAALLAKLIESGTPAALVAEVATELGRAQAERDILERKKEQDRERQRRHRSRDVTLRHAKRRDSRDPPKEVSNPHSVSDETGGKPPDPVKELFDLGTSVLTASGQTEKQARSLVGMWRKDHGDGEVLAALTDARTKSISNPVEWVPKRLKQRGPAEPADFLSHYRQRAAVGASP
jgi:hypothetical protein